MSEDFEKFRFLGQCVWLHAHLGGMAYRRGDNPMYLVHPAHSAKVAIGEEQKKQYAIDLHVML